MPTFTKVKHICDACLLQFITIEQVLFINLIHTVDSSAKYIAVFGNLTLHRFRIGLIVYLLLALCTRTYATLLTENIVILLDDDISFYLFHY